MRGATGLDLGGSTEGAGDAERSEFFRTKESGGTSTASMGANLGEWPLDFILDFCAFRGAECKSGSLKSTSITSICLGASSIARPGIDLRFEKNFIHVDFESGRVSIIGLRAIELFGIESFLDTLSALELSIPSPF